VFGDRKGLSTVIGAVLVFMTLSSLYLIYQTTYIPKICKSYEDRHFHELLKEVLSFENAVLDVYHKNAPTTFCFKELSGNYPVIPFFYTPNGFSGCIYTKPVSFTIENVEGVGSYSFFKPNGPLEYNVSTIFVYATYVYSQAPIVAIEHGIVALKAGEKWVYVDGWIVKNDTIRLVEFAGAIQSQTDYSQPLLLYPASAGGTGVTVHGKDGKPIILKLKTNIDDESFWENYGDEIFLGARSVTYFPSNKTVVVTLESGKNYTLLVGIVTGSTHKFEPNYIVNLTPRDQYGNLGVLSVKLYDKFGNPTVGSVDFTFDSGWTSSGNTANLSVFYAKYSSANSWSQWSLGEPVRVKSQINGIASLTIRIEDPDPAYQVLFKYGILGHPLEGVFLVSGGNW
jgi:hypothetical protein